MASITFELKVFDEDYRKIGFWKFSGKDASKFINIINKKYDLGFRVKDNKKIDNDLNWAR